LANRNILVMEDEPLVAMMLEDELEAMGIHVVGPANNLKSALQLAEFLKLDGALLDLNINGVYATKVADKLRTRGVPFVLSPAMIALPACATETFPSCTNHFQKLISEWRSSRSWRNRRRCDE
jgi:CheY-like chemotaxis protein